jgi:DNA polymerase elongation subunit (family B)
MNSKKFYYAKRLHLNPNLHGSDTDITDHYIGRFLDKYEQPKAPLLTKGFLDIEVNVREYEGFPDEHEAPCELNVVTYIHEPTMEIFTFILVDENNESLLGFYENNEAYKPWLLDSMKDECNVEFSKIHLLFFDKEIDLIKTLFSTINDLKPDFCGMWNAQFDFLTLYNRIKQLGKTPEKIMCPSEMPYKKVYFSEDTRHQDPAEKNSHIDVSCYTNYIDTMLLYASIRKTMGKKDSYSLDAISEEELGMKKLDLGADNVRTLPFSDFPEFVKYNIRDVVLLYMLDKKLGDINLIYSLAVKTRTRVSKAFTKTVCIKNLMKHFCEQQGWIMSNNHNATYGGDRESNDKFKGAFVSDPLLNAKVGTIVNGEPSQFIFEKVIDMDLSSLYPSIILAFNIDLQTEFGKIILNQDEVDMSPQFMNGVISKNWARLGEEWFGLPSPDELIKKYS